MPALALVLGSLWLSGCASVSTDPQNQPETVDHVDLQKYSGKWYEIARYPTWFQRGCECATAEYEVIGPESVRVTNTCYKADGSIKSISGTARPANTGNSKLLVRFDIFVSKIFPGLTTGKYWVLHVDDDYQHAVVGHPNRDYLWILARDPSIGIEKYQELVAIAVDQGYDADKLMEGECSALPQAKEE